MTAVSSCFPERLAGDALDVVPLLRHGLLAGDDDDLLITFEDQVIRRGRLRAAIARIQRALKARALRRGDHVAVLAANSADHVALIYALLAAGLVWIPVNTRLRGAGLAYVLEHARPRLLITEAGFREALAPIGGGPATADLDEIATGACRDSSGRDLDRDLVFEVQDPGAALCIIYTSGTTGPPKGVVFTHRMMRIATEAALRVAHIGAGDCAFVWEPLCHIGGAQMLMVPFLVRARLHIVRRFSASRFWAQWVTAGATHLHYLGGVLDILMQMPESARPPGASIPIAWGAGVSARAWPAIRRRLGCELRECYGMTECSSFATFNAGGKPGSIGRALPWIRIELLDDEGLPVPLGETGELVLSSDLPGVFLPGYFRNPEATAKALRNGKLHTGDAARRDADGDYFFVGRMTDSMRVRGENVSAWEIERVIAEYRGIAALAAVGVTSEVGEQEILLYVQCEPGVTVDWPALVAWAEPKLASYQLPRYYRQIDRFDLTPSERVQKHRLARTIEGAWDRARWRAAR